MIKRYNNKIYEVFIYKNNSNKYNIIYDQIKKTGDRVFKKDLIFFDNVKSKSIDEAITKTINGIDYIFKNKEEFIEDE